jgi:hypothetical protein
MINEVAGRLYWSDSASATPIPLNSANESNTGSRETVVMA